MMSSATKRFGADTRYNDSVTKLTFSQHFLLGKTLHCLVSFNARYHSPSFYVDEALWAKYFLLHMLYIPSTFEYIVDGLQYKSTKSQWIVQFNLNAMLSDARSSVVTKLSTKNFSILTTSTIYHSSIWLERELSDFTGIDFKGLTDTRRLLLDYFEDKRVWQTHISNDKNYNNVLYDVCLAF